MPLLSLLFFCVIKACDVGNLYNILDMEGINILRNSVTKQGTNILFFAASEIDGIHYCDIGLTLSSLIKDRIWNRNLSIITNDALDSIIRKNVRNEESIGNYIAIRNIGILFEPELKLNVHDKLRKYSREQTLVVNMEGRVQKNYFLFQGDHKYSISLTDITYKIIP